MLSNQVLEINPNSNSPNDTLAIARIVGAKLRGGEVIELISDLGGGKTVFVRGLAIGIESNDQVQSPTFTISRIYHGHKSLELHHFDFYRLDDPGVTREALTESLQQPKTSVVIEWSDVVRGVLPTERLRLQITATGEESRHLQFKASGSKHRRLLKDLR